MASMTPKQAIVSPRKGVLPDSTATHRDAEHREREKFGRADENKIIGRTIGSTAAISTAPNRPPIRADM